MAIKGFLKLKCKKSRKSKDFYNWIDNLENSQKARKNLEKFENREIVKLEKPFQDLDYLYCLS